MKVDDVLKFVTENKYLLENADMYYKRVVGSVTVYRKCTLVSFRITIKKDPDSCVKVIIKMFENSEWSEDIVDFAELMFEEDVEKELQAGYTSITVRK